jgi:hypothetical protein
MANTNLLLIMGVDMKMLRLGTSVLIGLLLGMPELSAGTADISTVVHATSFSLDALLDKPEITLTNGKTLMVFLDEALKSKLLAEQKVPDADKRITKAFVEYFEKTKLTDVFDKVMGFDFFISSSSGRIDRRTFAGENAK